MVKKEPIDVDAMDTSEDEAPVPSKSKSNTASRKRKKYSEVNLVDDDVVKPPTKKRKTSETTSKATKRSTTTKKTPAKTKKSSTAKKTVKKSKDDTANPDDPEDNDPANDYSDGELDEIIDETRQSSKATDLWVEKYAPKQSSQILGHRTELRVLAFWLQNFSANFVNKKKKPIPKPTDLKSLKQKRLFFETKRHRAVLLSGIAGIGKTSAAHLVCRENGYEVIEWNASDVRSKKQIQQQISHVTGNMTLDAFYDPESRKKLKQKRRKVAIILDEIDGMSTGDRGGISEVIKLIKDTKVPIICIANDARKRNITTLTKYCLPLSFSRPRKDIIQKYLFKICEREGLNIDMETLLRVIESLRNDIRCVLNNLQFMNLYDVESTKSADTIRKGAEQVNVFQVADSVFRTRDNERTHNTMINRYFYDPILIPLFVQENYANMRRSAWDPQERIQRISDAADWMSEGDLLELRIRQHQEWQLAPVHAMHSVVAPSFFCHGGFENLRPGDQFIIHFPASLGKGSTERKNHALINVYKHNSEKIAPASFEDIILDYVPMWNSFVGAHLTPHDGKSGEGDIGEVLDFMDEYGLTREDLDSISELHTFKEAITVDFDFKKVPSTTKSKLTRSYNAAAHNVSVAEVMKKQRAPTTYASIVDEEGMKNELFVDETTEVDDDPENQLDPNMAQREKDSGKKGAAKKGAGAKKPAVKKTTAKKATAPRKKTPAKKAATSKKK